ncbi:MAG: transcriptional regulator [Candidatus Heimdallarchaeota archaeon]|nr:transcriptional regulator [Candidatus Heimdallarchaeota archaeon]
MSEDVDIEINKTIHQPVRLKILTYLVATEEVDMIFLKDKINQSWGSISAQASALEEAGYIEIVKLDDELNKRKTKTVLRITEEGKLAFEEYKESMLGLLGS